MSEPVKILLIDNHPLVLDGLKALLETYSHIEVVGTAGLRVPVSTSPFARSRTLS